MKFYSKKYTIRTIERKTVVVLSKDCYKKRHELENAFSYQLFRADIEILLVKSKESLKIPQMSASAKEKIGS
jgi:hypothetical protein